MHYTLLLSLLLTTTTATHAQTPFFIEVPFEDDDEFGYIPKGTLIEPKGQVNALVIFAQFADEANKGDALPSYANDLFNPDIPGSFAHFYQTMSCGQLTIHGTVMPKRYTSLSPASAYLSPTDDAKGHFDRFADEILAQIDAELDLGQFNNDGPDGIANSEDDDRRVDYVFMLMRSVPSRFLLGNATGIAGLKTKYRSEDLNGVGKKLYISGMRYHGTIFRAGNFLQAAGIMVHEFGHSLGLPDLYDLDYTNPEDDSAGIGLWGVMGRDGTYGWNGGGASPFCAWSRETLGWLGPDNSQLIEITADATDLTLADLSQGGAVYKIPLPTYLKDEEPQQEYLLLEYRDPTADYYNRNQPGAGLLTWHVRPGADNNDYEEFKKVDLICADGLYRDAGYPGGQQQAPRQGSDNLDFWAHDEDYRQTHHGNSGDATDLFDGVRFRRLDLDSNPSTALVQAQTPSASGLSIAIGRQGGRPTLSIDLPGDANELAVSSEPDVAAEVSSGSSANQPTAESNIDDLANHSGAPEATDETDAVDTANEDNLNDTRLEQPALEERVSRSDAADVATAVLELDQESFTAQQPQSFALLPNYPNPFGPQTTIPYQLAEACPVRVEIYNTLGQRVRTLVDAFQSAGRQEIRWDGRDENGYMAATGVYLCRLEAEDLFAQARQMLRLPGYAQMTTIDSTLENSGQDWSRLRPFLAGADTHFGYAHQLSPEQAAFAAGIAWTQLETAARYGADVQGTHSYIETLMDLLPNFAPSSKQTATTRALLTRLHTDDVASAEPIESFANAHWAVDHIVSALSDEAALLFFAGKWLQRLNVAALAAQRLGVALDDALDLQANAQTSRHLQEALQTHQAADAFAERFTALATQLETSAQQQGETSALLSQLTDLVSAMQNYASVK